MKPPNSFDPNFQHNSRPGWQHLPRATRDAHIYSPNVSPKQRVYWYLLQVWDKESEHHLALGEKSAPIRQVEICNAVGLKRDHVNHIVNELCDEGLIELGYAGRVVPIEEPKITAAHEESEASQVKEYWAKTYADEAEQYFEWERRAVLWKRRYREIRREMKNKPPADSDGGNSGPGNDGPTDGPTNGPIQPTSGMGPDVGPPDFGVGPRLGPDVGPPPILRVKEKAEEAAAADTISAAMGPYGICNAAAAAELIQNCRKTVPDATILEMVRAIEIKGPMVAARRSTTNCIGLLLTSVPQDLPIIVSALRKTNPAPQSQPPEDEPEPSPPEKISRVLETIVHSPDTPGWNNSFRELLQRYWKQWPEEFGHELAKLQTVDARNFLRIQSLTFRSRADA